MEATAIRPTPKNVQEATFPRSHSARATYTPRKKMTSRASPKLADSISRQGILHAIGVRPIPMTATIVYGERRYRASSSQGKRTSQATVLYRPFR